MKITRKDGQLHVEIEDFVSPTIIERLAQQSGVLQPQIEDWRAMVDCVMIDPVYDGEVFNVALSDIAAEEGRPGIGRLHPTRARRRDHGRGEDHRHGGRRSAGDGTGIVANSASRPPACGFSPLPIIVGILWLQGRRRAIGRSIAPRSTLTLQGTRRRPLLLFG